MSYQDTAHHYEDGPEQPWPPAFDRVTEHTARKDHHCGSCQGPIKAGERYQARVWMDEDEGFSTAKYHVDRLRCVQQAAEVEAWNLKCQQEADYGD